MAEEEKPVKKRRSHVLDHFEEKAKEAPKEDDAGPLEGIDEAFGLDEFTK